MNIQLDFDDFACLVNKYKGFDKKFSDYAIKKIYQEVIDENDTGDGADLYDFLQGYREYESIKEACRILNLTKNELYLKFDLIYTLENGNVLIAKY